VVYREAFKFPTEGDLLNPNKSQTLNWASSIYDGMRDKGEYQRITSDALNLLRKAGVITEYEGSVLIPSTAYRMIKSDEDFRQCIEENRAELCKSRKLCRKIAITD